MLKNHVISYFEHVSLNDELIEEFNHFFYMNLLPLFTNDHRTGSIRVSDLDLRSVLNVNSRYRKMLTDFSTYVSFAQQNKAYEEAMFKMIYGARSFKGFMNNIEKAKNYIEKDIEVGKLFNMWNIVFYTKELK